MKSRNASKKRSETKFRIVFWIFTPFAGLLSACAGPQSSLSPQGPAATRIATLAQLTAFDFVLLLIVGESTQQALLGNDFSLTNAFLVILTLIAFDIALSLWKQRSPMLDRLIDGVPLVIVEEGRPLKERMDQARVDEADVLAAARLSKGLERMDQIKYAVLERSGGISIISRSGS